MKDNLLNWLKCPKCSGTLNISNDQPIARCEISYEVIKGFLKCAFCGSVFPIIDSIPRFTADEGYARNFGFQWNLFRKTQLDSYTKTKISSNRFFRQTAWRSDEMHGSLVLDAGCGAGRFAEIALSTGAEVIAFDYSRAVDACWQNLKQYPNLHVVQADIYSLPFKSGIFDFVYSFGVLQHTPDAQRALRSLIKVLRENGKVCVDIYRKDLRTFLWPKTWIRPLTKKVQPDTLFKIIKHITPTLLPLSCLLGKIPLFGYHLKYFLPVANYKGVFPLNSRQLLEWAVLDTFDMLSPAFDNPQSIQTMRKWFKSLPVSDCEILDCGVLVGRGLKNKM